MEVSRYSYQSVCPTCRIYDKPQNLPVRRIGSSAWLWASTASSGALATRDLGVILRTYRKMNNLSQGQLGEILGFDKTYMSMIETGRRVISDVATRRRIARAIGIPAHVLGVTDDDADFTTVLQFADSMIRLAETARQSGHATEAVNELWPLVARLEARASEGRVDREMLLLLAQARLALGVCLGDLLPEERLATAASWTGKAVRVAERLGVTTFLARALQRHGNELRKADHTITAIARLQRSAFLANDPGSRGSAYALLARTAGERGDAVLFDESMRRCCELLDEGSGNSVLLNPFSLQEIQQRGLMSTGRSHRAAKLINTDRPAAMSITPQWQVIERVTRGQTLLATREQDGAREALCQALADAETFRLPHQVQRTIRAAERGGLTDLAAAGNDVLARLRAGLAQPLGRAR